VIKSHAGRKYATDAATAALFARCCRQAGVPFQRFVNRSDVASGGTIGSMTAAQLGIPVVDVGSAQWAMHSVRETAGALDPWYMTRALGAFYLG
jgi:aspartyl aminopeptidase